MQIQYVPHIRSHLQAPGSPFLAAGHMHLHFHALSGLPKTRQKSTVWDLRGRPAGVGGAAATGIETPIDVIFEAPIDAIFNDDAVVETEDDLLGDDSTDVPVIDEPPADEAKRDDELDDVDPATGESDDEDELDDEQGDDRTGDERGGERKGEGKTRGDKPKG